VKVVATCNSVLLLQLLSGLLSFLLFCSCVRKDDVVNVEEYDDPVSDHTAELVEDASEA
jgi:hypothetical protein